MKEQKPEGINKKEIEKMLKALEATGIPWQKTTIPNKNKRPPIFIPSVWTNPPKIDKDWEKQVEEQETIRFMQECRERTANMKDDEKCAKCKLRFRCYTEIKVEKKRKTRVRKPRGMKIGTQPIRPQVLYTKSVIGSDDDLDWLKVVEDVAKDTRPDIKKEV